MNTNDGFPIGRRDVCDQLQTRIEQLSRCDADRPNPVVTLTYAQSIDGCIAPLGGGTLQLSNERTQRLTHQLRAFHDAILVGINTVICDNPRLSVRLVSGDSPQPIILDSRLRFPLEANLLRDPKTRPIIAAGPSACRDKAARLTAAGARVIRVSLQEDGLIDLSELLPRIKKMGFRSVMVEGGARVITNMLATHVADHLLLAIAPRLVGGLHAVNPIHSRQPMPQLHEVQYQLMEGDVVVWGDLKPANGKSCVAISPTPATRSLPD